MAGLAEIDTGYKPEFGLGALYQGMNAANADMSAQEEILRQFLANQREQQMQPLDIEKARLGNIGLGYSPITNDTAQFFYANLFNANVTTLYVGGAFTSPASYLASWNGSSWNDLSGNTLNNIVYTLYVSGTNLYLKFFT